MSDIDTTAAFDTDAAGTEDDTAARRAELEAQLDALDRGKPIDGELVTTDETDGDVEQPESIEVDGDTWHYFEPDEGQLTVFAMASSSARGLSVQDRYARFYGFFSNVFTDESWTLMQDRMQDRTDDFSFDNVGNIISAITEKMGRGEPTNRAERRALARRKK